jgi:6-phosphogluconolactonase
MMHRNRTRSKKETEMSETNARTIRVVQDPAALAVEAAERFVALAAAAIQAHGRFRVALSGGSTPRAMHQYLAEHHRDDVDWANVEVFWGDERFVPLDHPDSCYRMARETLLDHVHILAANIYPMPTVGSTPEECASAYAETLTAVFGTDLPRFDLIFLGMGPDGHTASLFPGHPEVVAPTDALVAPVYNSPKPPPTRVTFTYRLLNNAAQIIFLAGGSDKAATLRDVLEGPANRVQLPSQGVVPTNGQLTWLVDQAAAAQLSGRA